MAGGPPRRRNGYRQFEAPLSRSTSRGRRGISGAMPSYVRRSPGTGGAISIRVSPAIQDSNSETIKVTQEELIRARRGVSGVMPFYIRRSPRTGGATLIRVSPTIQDSNSETIKVTQEELIAQARLEKRADRREVSVSPAII